jgi:transposase InsO family protein
VELPQQPLLLKEALVNIHANARLTFRARRELVELMIVGFPVNEVAAQFSVSRQTVYKWWRRWQLEGDQGLRDRSSRPRCCPTQTPRRIERRIERLRRTRKLGPARIGGIVEMAPSTVYRVLARRRLNRLAWMHRPTGRVVRRIHTTRCGELVHVDSKRLARIPSGGGWRAHGRSTATKFYGGGYDHVHSAIDAYSRVAYSEILPSNDIACCTGFWRRAIAFFSEHNIAVDAVLTDNAKAYLGLDWAQLCDKHGIEHRRIRPYTPRTNGKVERFNRTLADEWAYVRVYRRNIDRVRALDKWIHLYNHHRSHTALGGDTPMSRVNNLPRHHN